LRSSVENPGGGLAWAGARRIVDIDAEMARTTAVRAELARMAAAALHVDTVPTRPRHLAPAPERSLRNDRI
jgi:hypothetical protein